jgi:endonuclease G
MVPENHLDYSRQAMTDADNMTNILPQTSVMNRGAWLVTEEIIECYRDFSKLTVIGGTIWGNNTADDFFVTSHNVTTPDAYWKIVINKTTNQSISWIVPNTSEATRQNIDKYLVSINDIEKRTGEKLNLSTINKTTKLSTSWKIPETCKKN